VHDSVVDAPEPRLLFRPEEADQLPLAFRHALAQSYYASLLTLLAAERLDAARVLATAAGEGYWRWRTPLSEEERTMIAEIDRALAEQ
jgi:hypothetical protein